MNLFKQNETTKIEKNAKKKMETFVLGKVSQLTLARQGNVNEATIFFQMIWHR